MKDSLRKEHFYTHSIDRVWKAITDQNEIAEWFLKADFKPTIGYQYTLTHEDTTISGKILEASPVNKLVYTWIVSGTGDVETTVSWQLTEADGGTKLVIEHTGISNYPDEKLATTMFNSYSGGWDGCITNLEKYLNKVAHVK